MDRMLKDMDVRWTFIRQIKAVSSLTELQAIYDQETAYRQFTAGAIVAGEAARRGFSLLLA